MDPIVTPILLMVGKKALIKGGVALGAKVFQEVVSDPGLASQFGHVAFEMGRDAGADALSNVFDVVGDILSNL